MKLILLFLLGISSTFATPAALGQFPHHASLFVSDGETFRLCDGALIRYNWILSSAHCVVYKHDITVELGVVDLWRASPQYTEHIDALTNPLQVRIHPNFDNFLNPYHDDIALINLLSTPAILTGNINVIALPLASDTNTAGSTGTLSGIFNFIFHNFSSFYELSGFGYEEPDYDYTLRYMQFPIMTNAWCALLHGDRIIDSKLCVDTLDTTAMCLEGKF